MKQALAGLISLISLSSFGQDHFPGYKKDVRNNCMVWCQYPSDSITWTGTCKNNMAEGLGTATWYNGGWESERYTGKMESGKAGGSGKRTYPDGRFLEGNFTDGEFLDLDEPCLKRLTKNILAETDSTDLYVSDGDSKSLFYYSLLPEKSIKGVLVLLPSGWETAEHAISSTKEICRLAFENQLAVIVPSINQHIMLTDANLEFLNSVFTDAIKRYKLPGDKFILGGLSMGGHMSTRYAELAVQDRTKTVLMPKAILNVDGPIDLENLYRLWQANLLNERNMNKAEPLYAISELEKYIGGSPEKFHNNYVYYSIYSRSEKDGGNAKYLARLPIRIYNDVDVNWWIANRGVDLYGMNALDQSAMINYLIGTGNQKAEFINALGKGYRIEGNRHPHSWSIVDPADCMNWILECLK